ncbi:Rpn family recombination-promoting nuclease/putative transposase, partial [Endothiovibrio diazotrophicus]
TDFHELVAPLPEALQPFVPHFRYALHDISSHSETEIRGEVLTRLVQLALRHIYSDRPAERLAELVALMVEVLESEGAPAILESLLRYYVKGTQTLEEGDVREVLERAPRGGELMQTFIDRYIEQGQQVGRKEGREEGREEGRVEGRHEGQALVLLRQIELKFGAPTSAIVARVEAADDETLLRWSERILTAEAIEQVFQ